MTTSVIVADSIQYDKIIIGGGSAGCVVASRLSENPALSILLVEAGSEDKHPLYHLPAGFAKMTKGIGSWGWNTVPQRHLQQKIFRLPKQPKVTHLLVTESWRV